MASSTLTLTQGSIGISRSRSLNRWQSEKIRTTIPCLTKIWWQRPREWIQIKKSKDLQLVMWHLSTSQSSTFPSSDPLSKAWKSIGRKLSCSSTVTLSLSFRPAPQTSICQAYWAISITIWEAPRSYTTLQKERSKAISRPPSSGLACLAVITRDSKWEQVSRRMKSQLKNWWLSISSLTQLKTWRKIKRNGFNSWERRVFLSTINKTRYSCKSTCSRTLLLVKQSARATRNSNFPHLCFKGKGATFRLVISSFITTVC